MDSVGDQCSPLSSFKFLHALDAARSTEYGYTSSRGPFRLASTGSTPLRFGQRINECGSRPVWLFEESPLPWRNLGKCAAMQPTEKANHQVRSLSIKRRTTMNVSIFVALCVCLSFDASSRLDNSAGCKHDGAFATPISIVGFVGDAISIESPTL